MLLRRFCGTSTRGLRMWPGSALGVVARRYTATTSDGDLSRTARTLRLMLTGPSGVGKSTIVEELTKHRPFLRLRSHTTRPQRPNEPDDAYYFVTHDAFEATAMLEQIEYHGNKYGLSADTLRAACDKGDVLHTASCDSFTNYLPLGFKCIMLLAPHADELERRLLERDGHDGRVSIAWEEHAIAHDVGAESAHHCVMNDDLATAVADVLRIIDEMREECE